MKKKILGIDDSIDIRTLLREILSDDYDFIAEENAEFGLQTALKFKPDLVILDLGLPGMDGLELCGRFRKLPDLEQVPIIILSGFKGHEIHSKAYDLGADNYLEKPFVPDELLSLINSKFRLSKSITRKSIGDVTMDLSVGSVYVKGSKIDLTPKEFKILNVMWDNVGEIVTRQKILTSVWENVHVSDRVIDNHMTSLRKKMGEAGVMIESVYGEGYRLQIQYF